MADHSSRPDRREVAEEGESLLRITLAPTVWALHFVASYASAAIYCAKRASGAEDIAVLRIGIGLGTIAALATILWLGHSAWRQWLAAKGRSGREMIEDLVEEGRTGTDSSVTPGSCSRSYRSSASSTPPCLPR